jgi:signal transduction histidine kinase
MSTFSRLTGWMRHLSLRTKITVVTVALVAVTLVIGGLLILAALRSELIDDADDTGALRAHELAGAVERSDLDSSIPQMSDPESFAQVVVDGRVVASSDEPDGTDLGLPPQSPNSLEVYQIGQLPVPKVGPYRVTALGVAGPDGDATVYVAVSIDGVEDLMATVRRTAAYGGVGLLTVLAVLTWLSIDRTLAPVGAIGAHAEAITGQNLSARVPEPERDDEIGRLARIVNRMLSRLEASSERQQRFVADAAHELRTPIASLRTQLETAIAAGGGADERELLKDTIRMQAIVEQLLLLARADSDRAWLRQSAVDLDEVIDSAIAAAPSRNGVRINAAAVEPVQLYGDGDLLEQTFSNLLQNAVRHAGSSVRVSGGEADGGVAVVAVEDDGPGVPPDRRADIFERFVRLDEARDRHDGGLGLGLAIVTEIVRAHGGSVTVDGSDLGGARFVVRLPIDGARPLDPRKGNGV